MNIADLPRVRLALLPSPIEELPRLSGHLGGPRLLMKRDDYTGLGLGGNKLRELEFLLADAVRQGADTVVTTGGVQSNHSRLTAAAARRLGLESALLLTGADPPPARCQGNLLLDRLFGAEIHLSATRDLDEAQSQLEALACDLRRRGRRPYVVPVGGYSGLGVVSYALAMMETVTQANEMGVVLHRIALACGTGVTMAGLVLGARLLGLHTAIHGFSVSRDRDLLRSRMLAVMDEAAGLLGVRERFAPEDLDIDDAFIGEGYGIPTPAGVEAMTLLARLEGTVLDPAYTGKAMGALIDRVRSGAWRAGENVLFLHTGGAPAVFAYEDLFAAAGDSGPAG